MEGLIEGSGSGRTNNYGTDPERATQVLYTYGSYGSGSGTPVKTVVSFI
jgi:hypothetical protein